MSQTLEPRIADAPRRFRPSINWLLVFVPAAVALEYAHVQPPVLFFSAALAIVPIARLIVLSTEQLATRTGDAIGGLLNATFGNAPELIIALVALRAGFFDMVRASIIGAILANLLLAIGVAFLLGGLRHHTQEYNSGAARLYSSMMLISAVSLGVPSAFNRFFSPDGTIHEEKLVNLGTAFVLLAAYAFYLVFLLKTSGSAVAMARKNKLDLTVGIAMGSSIQIALFVAPVLVLASIFVAPQPLELSFSRAELGTLFLGVLVGAIVAGDGRSNWYKGVQLVLMYLMIAILFYFLPQGAH